MSIIGFGPVPNKLSRKHRYQRYVCICLMQYNIHALHDQEKNGVRTYINVYHLFYKYQIKFTSKKRNGVLDSKRSWWIT